MKLNELLCYCEALQDVEIVFQNESICGKAVILKAYLCKDMLYMPVTSIVAEDAAIKVWVGSSD